MTVVAGSPEECMSMLSEWKGRMDWVPTVVREVYARRRFTACMQFETLSNEISLGIRFKNTFRLGTAEIDVYAGNTLWGDDNMRVLGFPLGTYVAKRERCVEGLLELTDLEAALKDPIDKHDALAYVFKLWCCHVIGSRQYWHSRGDVVSEEQCAAVKLELTKLTADLAPL